MSKVIWWTADGLAWVRIDALPVNAIDSDVRSGLLTACQAIGREPGVAAVILHSVGPIFSAGADIRELGQPSRSPSLPEVLAAIESSTIPWIAAIQGAALGGGLELIMACAGRVAGLNASFGLPEVSIGIIPGAGGTVRLPRLVDMKMAVDMVTSGNPVTAVAALAAGLVDRICDGDLLTEAASYALELAAKGATPTLQRPLRNADDIDWPAEAARLSAKSRGASGPIEGLLALEASASLSPESALADSRERFLRLADSAEAAALRHVFKAERGAGTALRSANLPNIELNTAGVVGGGTMGASIATALLLSGLRVRLLEQTDSTARQALQRIAELVDASRLRGAITDSAAQVALEQLSGCSDYADLADCQLVIEAVFEDMAAKQSVFRALEAVMPPDAILGTNTSYLDVNQIAAGTQHPNRVIGLHFFAPAHVMKLLEVVRGDRTDNRALAMGGALAKRLKKTAVISGVCDGFIGNRIMAAYRRAAEAMLEEGALPQDVDAAMRAFGFAMGIFEVQDLSGLDIAWAQRKSRRAAGKLEDGEGRIADQLCAAGRLGRKAGRGWYRYSDGHQSVDDDVRIIIEATSRALGQQRRPLSSDDIMRRILSVMQHEGQQILNEGIAASADDIDVVMIAGYGFPRHRGGPMFMAAFAAPTVPNA